MTFGDKGEFRDSIFDFSVGNWQFLAKMIARVESRFFLKWKNSKMHTKYDFWIFSNILHSEKCRELTLVMIFAQNEPENSRNSPYRWSYFDHRCLVDLIFYIEWLLTHELWFYTCGCIDRVPWFTTCLWFSIVIFIEIFILWPEPGDMKLERVVGKIEKLESLKLEKTF